MNELQAALKIALSNTFLMYFKSHSYHWNVEGMFFPMYHEFFGDLYADLQGAVDPFAEEIRAVDGYAHISLADIVATSTCTEDEVKPSSTRTMVDNLLTMNVQVIDSLNKAFQIAEQVNNQGLMDFLAGRLDTHAKHGWMLKSILKSSGE